MPYFWRGMPEKSTAWKSTGEAVLNARRNAALNSLSNVTVLEGEADKAIMELARLGEEAGIVILDPPRKGCSEVLLERLATMNTKRIVYVFLQPGDACQGSLISNSKRF